MGEGGKDCWPSRDERRNNVGVDAADAVPLPLLRHLEDRLLVRSADRKLHASRQSDLHAAVRECGGVNERADSERCEVQ